MLLSLVIQYGTLLSSNSHHIRTTSELQHNTGLSTKSLKLSGHFWETFWRFWETNDKVGLRPKPIDTKKNYLQKVYTIPDQGAALNLSILFIPNFGPASQIKAGGN